MLVAAVALMELPTAGVEALAALAALLAASSSMHSLCSHLLQWLQLSSSESGLYGALQVQ